MAEAGRDWPIVKPEPGRHNRRMGWRQSGPLGVHGRQPHHGHPKHRVNHGHHAHSGDPAKPAKEGAHKKHRTRAPIVEEPPTSDPARNALELQPLTGGLTAPLLKQTMRGLPTVRAKRWVDALNAACRKYGITQSLRRMAAFLGHIALESGALAKTSENLNYTADQLLKYFKAFTPDEAKEYAHHPEEIANRAYGKRIGNGDEASGDGWKYRGRGLIQTTGRNNYAQLSEELDVDFVKDPDLVATPQYAALSAAFFFKKNGLNELADAERYKALSLRVNSSLKHFPEREANRKYALDALCRYVAADTTVPLAPVGVGASP